MFTGAGYWKKDLRGLREREKGICLIAIDKIMQNFNVFL
jgi:hypothetical protein